MNRKKWQVSVSLVCLVLGVLLAVQFRTQSAKERLPAGNSELLVRLYNEAKAQEAALAHEVETLRAELRQAGEGKSVLRGLNSELRKALLLAGTTKVAGPGIQITLESPVAGRRQSKEELFLVHDEDLLNVVNELVAAGAEAIAINGERRVALTEIRRAGALISVNNRSTGEPFVIKAIGDPENLLRSLEIRGGVLDSLRAWGINVTVQPVKELLLPAYRPAAAPAAASPGPGKGRDGEGAVEL
ncbi:MAG: DUF881 domain-containing protein [Bacillota bacterium]|nr:DUF881 domain-containing protein [Bacillota bacterium]